MCRLPWAYCRGRPVMPSRLIHPPHTGPQNLAPFSVLCGRFAPFHLLLKQDDEKVRNRLSKFTYTGSASDTLASEEILITTDPKATAVHASGWVAFKPSARGQTENVSDSERRTYCNIRYWCIWYLIVFMPMSSTFRLSQARKTYPDAFLTATMEWRKEGFSGRSPLFRQNDTSIAVDMTWPVTGKS